MLVAAGLIGLLLFSGSEVVENDFAPQGQAYTMTFTEDLRIGDDSDDNYFWSGLYPTVSADSKGHIYVADNGGLRVLEYDSNGTFVRLIGSKGEGPGQFTALSSYQVLADDRAVAFGLVGYAIPKFSFFDAKGTYLNAYQPQDMSNMIQSVIFAPNGANSLIFSIKVDPKGKRITFLSGVADSKLKLEKTLSSREQAAFNPRRIRDQNYWAKYLAKSIGAVAKGYGVAAFDNKGRIYTAVSTNYEITRWHPLQQKELVIKKKYKPIPFSEDEMEAFADRQAWNSMGSLPPALRHIITPAVIKKAIARAEIPPAKPAIMGMFATETGHLLVIRDINEIDRSGVVDIFDEQGRFLGTASLENFAFGSTSDPRRMQFRNGYAYTVETDEDDNNFVVRYRYELVKK